MASRPATQAEKHHKINTGLDDKQRRQVIDILNRIVADQHVIYMKTRKYHWNLVGPNFYGLHKLLEEQYDALALAIDETAERVRQVGGRTIGTMNEMIEFATLQEDPGVYPAARDMVHNLLHDHEAAIRQLREDIDKLDEEIGDVVTADFVTGLAAAHEKMAWMLGSIVADDHSLDRQEGGADNGRRSSRK